jgi:Fe-S cluster assembly ATP-binding protein
MSSALEVVDLSAAVDGNQILDRLSIEVPFGEIHAVMGPNGSGKSTLCHVLTGKPGYQVRGGAKVDGEEILSLEVDERSRLGLLQSFQYPTEIRGVRLGEFLREAAEERGIDPDEAASRIEAESERFGMKRFLDRSLNDDLSGGEKKRSEIFQLAVLRPRMALLDEIDSGLDIDAVRQVAEAVESMRSPDMGLLMITHYSRILRYLTPDRIHIMLDGRIVESGGAELADVLEEGGYEAVRERLGIERPSKEGPTRRRLMTTAEGWLADLTNLPTASGLEDAVVDWVKAWVAARDDLEVVADSGGNLFITQSGDKGHDPLFAVAHMDHPAFVLTDDRGNFEFRGGVDAAYFEDASIEVVSGLERTTGRVESYDPETHTGSAHFESEVSPGDIAMWTFPSRQLQDDGRFRAPSCDDLAGAAAALAALDRARRDPALRHFGVMLTRGEEVGLIGAIHAAKHRTIPQGSRLLSIETSRELPNARIGDGPILRIGDRSTVFDRELSNRIARGAEEAGLVHQRKLMDGGGCEATAFGVYGYQATGLCLALGNWHNRGNLDLVEAGDAAAAVPMLEEISIDDFHGLVDLLLIAASAVDQPDSLHVALDRLYESNRHYLG